MFSEGFAELQIHYNVSDTPKTNFSFSLVIKNLQTHLKTSRKPRKWIEGPESQKR
jgi:hypothetical protein